MYLAPTTGVEVGHEPLGRDDPVALLHPVAQDGDRDAGGAVRDGLPADLDDNIVLPRAILGGLGQREREGEHVVPDAGHVT